jgi:hypothetical protein
MNFSTAAKVAISMLLLLSGCTHGSQGVTQQESAPAEVRRISPDELKAFLPPRLQGQNGPYINANGPKSNDAPPANSP